MDYTSSPESAYHYVVQPEYECNYYVYGSSPNYSPSNVTVYQTPPPEWINPVSFPEIKPSDGMEADPSFLLTDIQYDISSNTEYIHTAFKIWNAIDLQHLSQLQIDFDPSYENMTIHECKVFRDGRWISKLDMNELRVLQREKSLKDFIYTSRLTVLAFFEDVRIGDIIDCSFSRTGSLFKQFAEIFPIQYQIPPEKQYLRIIKPSNRIFQTQIFPSDWSQYLIETDNECVLEMTTNSAIKKEKNQPFGYRNSGYFEISENSDWNQTSSELIPLYLLNDSLSNDPEAMQLVNKWKENSTSLEEQAIQAVRFVQDEIRYVGIESGIDGFKPTDPLVTLQRRFGDCKGKSQLLRAFLSMLGIHSDICLVNTNLRECIKDYFPNRFLFNHAIIRITLHDHFVFVDSTIPNEGGNLNQSYCPFNCGLVIDEDRVELVPIFQEIANPEIECKTDLDLSSDNQINLNLNIDFYGIQATLSRNTWKKIGFKKMIEDFKNHLEAQFDDISMTTTPQIVDDRATNHLKISALIQLDEPWSTAGNKSDRYLIYIPYFLNPFVNQKLDNERKTPYRINPTHIKETITINRGFIAAENHTIEDPAFVFKVNSNDPHKVEFELNTLQEQVSVEEFYAFSENLDRANSAIEIIIRDRSGN